jgi:hypothetical protein
VAERPSFGRDPCMLGDLQLAAVGAGVVLVIVLASTLAACAAAAPARTSGTFARSRTARTSDRLKVSVQHSLVGRQALLVVVAEEAVEEVYRLVRDEALVVGGDEAGPWLALVATEEVVVLRVQVNVVPAPGYKT